MPFLVRSAPAGRTVVILLFTALAACRREPATPAPTAPASAPPVASATAPAPVRSPVASTCSGVWPSYWQDPAFAKVGMWNGQDLSNTPDSQGWKPGSPRYTNPAFRLADAYLTGKPDDPKSQTWRDPKFEALFKSKTSQADKTKLAHDYGWALMRYAQEGNVDSGNVNTDWDLCANTRRQWFHMPFQTYDVMSGREFTHGLTREAPIVYSVGSQPAPLGTTVWAVGFYNGNAAATLASAWGANGVASVPTRNMSFAEGTVIAKLLFTTATATTLPFLSGVPAWSANISTGKPDSPNPSSCKADAGASMPLQSQQCKRSLGTVTLLQFDVAVRDARAPSGWVFGTFVADGQERASEKSPWNRISLLGLTWGSDAPPAGKLASAYPANPKANGLAEAVIAWDVVDRLNKGSGSVVAQQPGHLGCGSRLSGPADNVASSCISCHMTASVPDQRDRTPPILAQFSQFSFPPLPPLTSQCASASAPPADQKNGVTYAQMDAIYFAPAHCASPVDMSANGSSVLGPDLPTYADGGRTWISTDFSLQMSGALVQWIQWQSHLAQERTAIAGGTNPPPRVFAAEVPSRGK